MKILGVDFGLKKVGLAVSEGFLAEPISVVRYEGFNDLIEKLGKVILDNKTEKIVVGISENKMAQETEKFISLLRSKFPTIQVDTYDETLSTKEAQAMAIQAGIKRKKRKEMEDAYAATLMLNNYLDAQA